MTIPSRKLLLSLVLLPIWLLVWALAIVSVSSELFRTKVPAVPAAFLVLWLAGWTAGGALAGLALVWQLAGREVLKVRDASFSIRREFLRIGWTNRYLAEHVRDLRALGASLSFSSMERKTPYMLEFGRGTLAFDYGSRTIRFGSGLDEAEAKMIVDAVLRRFPRFAPGSHSY